MISFASIASLVDKKNALLLHDYMLFLSLGEKHFLLKKTDTELCVEQLQLLEKAIRKEFKLKKNIIARLQRKFLQENLSLALLLDVLQGWRYGVQGNFAEEKCFSEVSAHMLAPLSRLLMVLYDENPCTYLPMNSLLVCLYWIHLIETDANLIKKMRLSKRNKINKLNGLIKNSNVILQLVFSKKLKFQLAILLNTLQIKIRKIAENEQPRIGTLDAVKIFWYSTLQFLIVRRKTVCKKGM